MVLLVIGPVSKQQFQLAGATLAGGVVVLGGSLVLPDSSEERWVNIAFYLGILGAVAGAVQLLVYGCMLKSYGWRPESGGRQTVWACQYCTQQFSTYEECLAHEQTCPYRTGPGGVQNIVGLPVGGGQPMATPMGQVYHQQACPPPGQQYNGAPYGQYQFAGQPAQATVVQAQPANNGVVQGTVVQGSVVPNNQVGARPGAGF